MRPRPSPVVSGVAALALLGCASGGPVSRNPVVSPTGIVYEAGTPPVETRRSQTAAVLLLQRRDQRALELALEGIESDPANPVHYYIAGVAHARLGAFEAADSMFREAQRIYPAYELRIEPERRAAWADAFNKGVEAYGLGEIESTIEAWSKAALIYDLRPDAHLNLASLLTSEGRHDEAIDFYQRALAGLAKRPATRVLEPNEARERTEARFRVEESLATLFLVRQRYVEAEELLRQQVTRNPTSLQARSDLGNALAGQGRREEAQVIFTALLEEEGLQAAQLLGLGVSLFQAKDFGGAARAFGRLTELQPESRDAWFNYANALFAAEDWAKLTAAGDRLAELDPLGENSQLITARALLETGDRQAARATLERVEAAPVYVDELQMRRTGVETSVHGRVTGNTAESGTPVRLQFTFYGDAGDVLGTESLTVLAPPDGESQRFAVLFQRRAMAYRYERLN